MSKINDTEVEENIIYFICYSNAENISMFRKLFDSRVIYTSCDCKDKIIIDDKEYLNIVNIGDRYSIYIRLRTKLSKEEIKYISLYIAIIISDYIFVYKTKNINEAISELDIALELGKDIYAIPGDILSYENYLANFCIKQGAIPICSKYDIKYILDKKKKDNVL